MLTEDLKRQLSGLRRGQPDPREAPVRARELAATTPRGGSSDLATCFPEGAFCATSHGEVFACRVPLSAVVSHAEQLTEWYRRAFLRARRLQEEETLPRFLGPMAEAEPESTVLIDTETTGFQGRPLFLIGLVQWGAEGLEVVQYFARDYAQEPALLAQLSGLLPETKLLVSFNGKAFDWPFVRDRMVYHRLSYTEEFTHLDLLHPSRRQWRARLPNCRLQTLERYLSGRYRSGDIPSAEIPQRYHDFVREQDARLISPIFHHNRLDLITMIEIMIALVATPPERESTHAAGR